MDTERPMLPNAESSSYRVKTVKMIKGLVARINLRV